LEGGKECETGRCAKVGIEEGIVASPVQITEYLCRLS